MQRRDWLCAIYNLHMRSASCAALSSPLIRRQLDWIAETVHRIFADAFELDIASDEVGERSRQQYRLAELLDECFQARRPCSRAWGGRKAALSPVAIRNSTIMLITRRQARYHAAIL